MTTAAEAGWYTETPDGPTLRYWDGQTWTEHRHPPVQGFPPPAPALTADTNSYSQSQALAASIHTQPRKPEPRLIRSPEDAERVAAEWMRFYGFDDARRTPSGPDGGLDVVATGAVAQVKDHGTAIGRPVLQQLHGAAGGRVTLCFGRQGFTPEATRWAAEVRMALFRFDLQGVPEPVNDVAVHIANGWSRGVSYVEARSRAETGWFIPRAIDDKAALSTIDSQRVGRFSQRERVAGVWHSWLQLYVVRYDMTEPVGRRQILRQTSLSVGLDSLAGRVFVGSKRERPAEEYALVDSLPSGFTPSGLVSRIQDEVTRLSQLKQAAARQRMVDVLTSRGLPVANIRTASASLAGILHHPTVVSILDTAAGRRVVVVDGVTGGYLQVASQHLTQDLRRLEHHLQSAPSVSL